MYPQAYNTGPLIDYPTFVANAPEVDISAYTPATFSGILQEASQWIYAACEVPTLLQSTIVGEETRGAIGPSGDLVIFPMVRPIQSVQAIKLVKGGFSTNLTISGISGGGGPLNFYQMPWPQNKIVYPSSYLAGQGTLMIGGSQQLVSLRGAGVDSVLNYTAGFQTISGIPYDPNGYPKYDLVRATVLVVRAILTDRYNQMGADSLHQGDVSISLRGEPYFYEMAMEILDKGGYHRVAPRV